MKMRIERQFEEIEHTADLAIKVWGSDIPDLFANAAYGMSCLLAEAVEEEDLEEEALEEEALEEEADTVRKTIELAAHDVETLLVDWLSELLFLGEQEDVVLTRIDELHVSGNRLRAIVRGGPARERRSAIKAVTFADLQIRETARGLETAIVFDV
jgi:SHS2 domain-containing protein